MNIKVLGGGCSRCEALLKAAKQAAANKIVGFAGALGYDYDPETKTISVNEEEAKVVRYILSPCRIQFQPSFPSLTARSCFCGSGQ